MSNNRTDASATGPLHSGGTAGSLIGGGPRPRICFVAPSAYNVLAGRDDLRHIGGAEVQQTVLARGLAARGYPVSMVTLDYGQPDGELCGDVRVYRSYRPDAGIPLIRFIWPRMTHIWMALRRANADIYYQRTSDSLTGIVALYCHRHNARFIFSLGAMADCDPLLPNCPSRRERWLYQYGLRRADCVVAQTQMQQTRLREHFGREALVIPSATPEPIETPVIRPSPNRPRFVWIGRFSWEKRPEWIAELAVRCPDFDFDVVGSVNATTHQTGRLLEELGRCPNVTVHGYVPPRDLDTYFRRATAILSTSVVEGFPNTFLEAWSRGVPVVTSVDPDDIVARYKTGLCAMDIEGLAGACHRLAGDPKIRSELSGNARRYYRANHTLDVVLDRYEAVFSKLLSPGPDH